MNILLSLLIGLAFGSVAIQPGGVLTVQPTTASSVWITGLIFGAIMGVLVTLGVARAIKAAVRDAAATPASEPTTPAQPSGNNRFAWLPKATVPLTIIVSLAAMLISALALPAIMRVLGIASLNFIQFIGFITIWAWLLGKAFGFVLKQRMQQPDYIAYLTAK